MIKYTFSTFKILKKENNAGRMQQYINKIKSGPQGPEKIKKIGGGNSATK